MKKFDIIIIGAGPIGSLCAILHADLGLKVAVIDRAPKKILANPKRDGRGIALTYGSKNVLEKLDIWQKIPKTEAEPIKEIRVSDGDSPMFLHFDGQEAGPHPLGYIVESHLVRKFIYQKLTKQKNITVFDEATISDFETDAHQVTVDLGNQQLTASLLVAADGRYSFAREKMGIEFINHDYGQTAMVCSVNHDKPHHGVAHERFLPPGPLAFLPMTGNKSSIVWTESPEEAKKIMTLSDEGYAKLMQSRFGPHLGDLELDGSRWAYPLKMIHARTYIGQRFVLVGDSAHAVHPIAGQGLNLGLRGVCTLAEEVEDMQKLGLDIGSCSVLKNYESRQKTAAISMIIATHGLNGLFATNAWPIKLVRDFGLSMVNEMPGMKNWFMRQAMGIQTKFSGRLPKMMG